MVVLSSTYDYSSKNLNGLQTYIICVTTLCVVHLSKMHFFSSLLYKFFQVRSKACRPQATFVSCRPFNFVNCHAKKASSFSIRFSSIKLYFLTNGQFFFVSGKSSSSSQVSLFLHNFLGEESRSVKLECNAGLRFEPGVNYSYF